MSAKFDFRLQPLLQRRERIEDEKRRDFASWRDSKSAGGAPSRRMRHAVKRSSWTRLTLGATIMRRGQGSSSTEPEERLRDRAHAAQWTAGHAELRPH